MPHSTVQFEVFTSLALPMMTFELGVEFKATICNYPAHDDSINTLVGTTPAAHSPQQKHACSYSSFVPASNDILHNSLTSPHTHLV